MLIPHRSRCASDLLDTADHGLLSDCRCREAIALAGCAAPATPPAPDVSAAVPAFRQASAIDSTALDATTWRGFGDPVLDELITRARSVNLDVRIATQRVRQARAASEVAAARTWPGLAATASASDRRTGLPEEVKRYSPDTRAVRAGIDLGWEVTRSGAVVPLSQVATLTPAFEEPVLWRRNRETALTVRADVLDGVQGPSASAKIWPTLQPVLDSLPPGYRIEVGGVAEETAKSNSALFAVFPLMFAAMLLFLMLQLQSFSRMWIVFLTAPLALIGVVPALLIFNAPFGFVALLGAIALSGMLMRNAVILVDQIDSDITAGVPPADAVVEATVRRSRPVVLTAAATVLAMVPLTGSVFWGPMAIAIMGGLIVGTVLTLAFVPALYAIWFRVQPGTAAR